MHLLLGLALLLSVTDGPPSAATDLARVREMLNDKQDPRNQDQAALLLVQNPASDAEEIVRQGLRQTNSEEVFMALAAAVRLRRDTRFADELFAALVGAKTSHRQAAEAALAEIADGNVLRRLRAIIEDMKADVAARQAAIAVLGRNARREAVFILLDQLGSEDEKLRQAAMDALSEATGQAYGQDVGRWRSWWELHKDLTNERWLEERLAYQSSRARRLRGELDQAKAQILRLHQQFYGRLPAGDRLSHVQSLAESEDPALRALAVSWCVELLATTDTVGQRALADLLLRFCRDGSAEVQRAAVLGLGSSNDPRALDKLLALLQHGPAGERGAAAHALAQQVKGSGRESPARQRQVIPALQKALDDPTLEVVVEAAESLGALGSPEAGPVLTVLLRHPSRSVRQTAALALERVADFSVLDGLLGTLDDPEVTVRFSLIGALGHAAGDGHDLSDQQRLRLVARLEAVFLRDTDPGVRSRAATVLGECGTVSILSTLWRRVQANEESRVQEKAWAAIVEVLIRAGNLELLRQWDRVLVESKQEQRRLQLLSEVATRWQKREDTRKSVAAVQELLVQTQLDQGKWIAALPQVRDLLGSASTDAEIEKRLHWLLAAGQLALMEGKRQEATRIAREAQPHLVRNASLAAEFEKLEKQAKP